MKNSYSYKDIENYWHYFIKSKKSIANFTFVILFYLSTIELINNYEIAINTSLRMQTPMKIAIHLPDGSQVCTKKQIIFTYEIQLLINFTKCML